MLDRKEKRIVNLHHGLELLARWTQHFDASSAAAPQRVAHHEGAGSERLQAKFGAARQIRQLRIRAGLSQQALAERMNLTVAEMIGVEIGEADCLRTLQLSEHVRRMLG